MARKKQPDGKRFDRGFLKGDPRQPRQNETIGGGFIVFRRGERTKRIRPALWPFEYASRDEALAEATKLAGNNPGFVFEVWALVDGAFAGPAPEPVFTTSTVAELEAALDLPPGSITERASA